MVALDEVSAIDAFSRLPWHDSELLGCCVSTSGTVKPIVSLEVDFGTVAAGPGHVVLNFEEPRGICASIDLLAKRLCSNHIWTGYAKRAVGSGHPFVKRIEERFDLDPSETIVGLLLFVVDLISPAGDVSILAKSFSISKGQGRESEQDQSR